MAALSWTGLVLPGHRPPDIGEPARLSGTSTETSESEKRGSACVTAGYYYGLAALYCCPTRVPNLQKVPAGQAEDTRGSQASRWSSVLCSCEGCFHVPRGTFVSYHVRKRELGGGGGPVQKVNTQVSGSHAHWQPTCIIAINYATCCPACMHASKLKDLM